MKVSLDGVVSEGVPEVVRSRDSRDSAMDPTVAIDLESFDFRESGGEASSGWRS